ncbi:phosphatidylglycerophosphatase A [Halanaerobacter jeridensis]|uniref:Phosphatidylglycerophosphatase A n=2 Tax=Halanaerobacter jeridensis TaxID=706427 RepID=A0A938XQT5_9FIRM|nr:phosphatidylglycerophosphatase A [Halanaerobacter jeridensis]
MKIKNSWIKFLATGFYSGLSPVAPGTAGTLLGVVLLYLSFKINLISQVDFPLAFLVVLSSVIIAQLAQERIYQEKDASEIVIDELAGYCLAMYLLPINMLIPAFVLFRIFDILKPQPIDKLEQFRGGLGVVMDDLGAGAITAVLLHFILLFV